MPDADMLHRLAERCWIGSGKVHRAAGKDGFEWIDQQRQGRAYDDFRLPFTRRVVAVTEYFSAMTCSRLRQVCTIVVGGNNTDFVSVSTLSRFAGLKIIPVPEGRPN